MKTPKEVRHRDTDELRKAKRLEPMHKSGKERHALYSRITDDAALPQSRPMGIDGIGKFMLSRISSFTGTILASKQAQIQNPVPDLIAIFTVIHERQTAVGIG